MPVEDHFLMLSRSLFLSAFAGNNRVREAQTQRLAPTLQERVVEPGTVLFREGDEPQYLYFMPDGEIEMSRPGVPPVVMRGKWLIGALECGIELPRLRTATMRTKSLLVASPAVVWREIFEDNFGMTQSALLGSTRLVEALHRRIQDEQIEGRVGKPEVYASLPDEPLDLVERLLVLSASTIFGAAGMQSLTALAAQAEEAWFESAAALRGASIERRSHTVISGVVHARRIGHAGRVTIGPGAALPPSLFTDTAYWQIDSEGPIRTLSNSLDTFANEFEEHADLRRSVLGALWHERDWLLSRLHAPAGEIVLT
jgi:hypothetical protein